MKPVRFLSILTVSLILTWSCKTNQYAATNKIYKKNVKQFAKVLREYPVVYSSGLPYAAEWAGTTNFTMRRPNYVIIHHTAQGSCDETLKTFTTTGGREVSADYVICKDGTVHHMLNDLLRAHHAGVSRWGNTTDLNSSSIGIELDNNGFEQFSEEQINSLLVLLERLKKAYSIPASNFIGHGDIAPTRKNDPNWRFPWKRLADKGFGFWFDSNVQENNISFNRMDALRIIGYDIKDSNAAVIAFKRHWLQDTTPGLNKYQLQVLENVSRKYR